ncbi:MAG TPA: glycosyltransferase family 4 protein [Solirubrobacteraceae bacterium]|nr:glycosyltransferase family 4 protein [Solirubrobacteraceae bacterium]
MRALVVTNMYPRAADPARGSFVRDQVEALRQLPDTEVEVFAFTSAGTSSYLRAARELRQRYRGVRFDIVHAHFGLTIWPSLAIHGPPHVVTLHGTDLAHPRSRLITAAGLPFVQLAAPVSESLMEMLPRTVLRGQVAVLPCGVNIDRFRAIDRAEARRSLGLDPRRPHLLFPADPARSEKRYDRALELAGDIPLLALGNVEPDQVPVRVNAANAVLVTSERESFGLAVLEALACDVPVLSTPVGVAPEALRGIERAHCGPFDLAAWRSVLQPLLADPDPRVRGREAAERYSAARMAQRVRAEWARLIGAGNSAV